MLFLLAIIVCVSLFWVNDLALALKCKYKNFRRIDAILDSGKFLELCETLFKIIDFKVYAHIRRLIITTQLKLQTMEQTQCIPLLTLDKTWFTLIRVT